jgi:hypothetical protein
MNDIEYATRQLFSAHVWMDRVYAAHIKSDGHLVDAYQSANRRLANAERRVRDMGLEPSDLVVWNSALQSWRIVR